MKVNPNAGFVMQLLHW